MSMRENELRVGVYIYYLEEVFKVDAECISMHWGDDLDDAYRPIPLTEEWLLKFGFKKNIDYELINEYGKLSESNGRRGVGLYFNDGEWFVTFREDVGCGWNDLNEINYVHQLQNLYFALTGDELII